ncbi:MAG TPA: hypothetical protein VNJ02_13425 [Vicinamibacterales bacterium]|nr:hypothetical protein [Vicinamibacterales bacterium]
MNNRPPAIAGEASCRAARRLRASTFGARPAAALGFAPGALHYGLMASSRLPPWGRSTPWAPSSSSR